MVAPTNPYPFADRLNRALKGAGIPDDRSRRSRLAQEFGVSRESVRKWLVGESIPDTKRIEEIAKYCGARGEWLLTGQGPMHIASPAADIAELPPGSGIEDYASHSYSIPRELLTAINSLVHCYHRDPATARRIAQVIQVLLNQD